jgi:hypothetical protein
MTTMKKLSLALTAAALAACISGQPVHAVTVQAGVLTCDVASGWGYVFGSTRDLKCTYSPAQGAPEHYVGHIDKFGVDIGYRAAGVVAWAVLAPTSDLGKGALAGEYSGPSAGAAVGVGGAVNFLVGGNEKTISLQPLNVEGNPGLNFAAGVTGITLRAEGA